MCQLVQEGLEGAQENAETVQRDRDADQIQNETAEVPQRYPQALSLALHIRLLTRPTLVGGGGGGNFMVNCFFVQSILADRYHRREM